MPSDQLTAEDGAVRLLDIAGFSIRQLSGSDPLLSPDDMACLNRTITAADRRVATDALMDTYLLVQRGLACRSPRLESSYNLGICLVDLAAAGTTPSAFASDADLRTHLLSAHDEVRDRTAEGFVNAGMGTLRGIRHEAGRAARAMWPVLLLLAIAVLGAGWKAVKAPSESAFSRFAARLSDAETDRAIADTITLLPADAAATPIQPAAKTQVAVPSLQVAPPAARALIDLT